MLLVYLNFLLVLGIRDSFFFYLEEGVKFKSIIWGICFNFIVIFLNYSINGNKVGEFILFS